VILPILDYRLLRLDTLPTLFSDLLVLFVIGLHIQIRTMIPTTTPMMMPAIDPPSRLLVAAEVEVIATVVVVLVA
jgi:hypothetical protein